MYVLKANGEQASCLTFEDLILYMFLSCFSLLFVPLISFPVFKCTSLESRTMLQFSFLSEFHT